MKRRVYVDFLGLVDGRLIIDLNDGYIDAIPTAICEGD